MKVCMKGSKMLPALKQDLPGKMTKEKCLSAKEINQPALCSTFLEAAQHYSQYDSYNSATLSPKRQQGYKHSSQAFCRNF